MRRAGVGVSVLTEKTGERGRTVNALDAQKLHVSVRQQSFCTVLETLLRGVSSSISSSSISTDVASL